MPRCCSAEQMTVPSGASRRSGMRSSSSAVTVMPGPGRAISMFRADNVRDEVLSFVPGDVGSFSIGPARPRARSCRYTDPRGGGNAGTRPEIAGAVPPERRNGRWAGKWRPRVSCDRGPPPRRCPDRHRGPSYGPGTGPRQKRRAAATGRWSLGVRGRVHAETGVRSRTRIWSIRATGSAAGQLKPKPAPAAWAG